jgi:hypothetical protein
MNIPLNLVPTAQVTLNMAQALRGQKGEPGQGLVGFVTVPEASPIVIDLSQVTGLYVTSLTAHRAITFTGGTADMDRKRFMVEVTQAGAGGWTLAPDATVAFGSDLPSITLSGSPGAVDILGFIYHHATGKCRFLAINHGS